MAANGVEKTTLLAVGDAPDELLTLEEAVADHASGWTILTARNAEEAVLTANRISPDAVLIDAQTPRIDGTYICDRLKSDSATAHIPIFLMTSHDASPAGADDFISIPIDNSELSARISAVRRMKKSEDKFRRLFEQSNDAVFVHSPEGKILDVNTRACEMLGYFRKQLLDMSIPQLHPESELDKARAAMKAMKSEESIRFESVFMGSDGALIDVEISARVVDPETGTVQGVVRDISTQKQFSETLRKERDFAESLIDTAQAIVLVLDTEGRIVRFNSYMEKLSGYRLDEVRGKDWFSTFLPPRDHKRIGKVFDRAISDIQAHGTTNPILTKSGQERLIEWSDKTLKNEQGDVIGILTVGHDITAHKQAEQAMRDSEERYRQVVSTTTDAVMVFDAETRQFVEVNESCTKLYGYSHDEFLNMKQSDITAEPDESDATIRQTLAGQRHRVPLRYHIKTDGTVFPVEISGSTFTLNGRQVACGLVRDITERKQAEARAARRSQINHMLLDSLPCVAMLVRPSTYEIVASNKAAAGVGASPGETCWSTWAQREKPCPWCMAPEAWATGQDQHIETEFLGIVWDIHWRKISDDLYLHYGFDVTERRYLEAKLRQAHKMEAIGRLAGGIAHDFRNQLTIITGYANRLLANAGDDSKHAGYAEQILEAAGRTSQLTGRMLAFSRKETLAPTVVAPMDIIGKLTDPLKRMIGEDVNLVTSGSDALPNITVDTAQFEHMLINLAVNARDAMPDGGDLRIDVASEELGGGQASRDMDLPPGRYVVISVSDTGVGMDAETRRNAFDPFFTTRPVGQGTGLGLSMVYGFVRQSGGYITIDSEPGCGTTFTIHLPGTAEASKETAPTRISPDKTNQATYTILTVEDDELLRNMLIDILQEEGHTVVSAGNAREAISLEESHEGKIDLLITDVVMPGMSGVELAGHLKDNRPDMSVVFISGYGDSELIRKGLDDYGAKLLLKPFGPDELLDSVGKALA